MPRRGQRILSGKYCSSAGSRRRHLKRYRLTPDRRGSAVIPACDGADECGNPQIPGSGHSSGQGQCIPDLSDSDEPGHQCRLCHADGRRAFGWAGHRSMSRMPKPPCRGICRRANMSASASRTLAQAWTRKPSAASLSRSSPPRGRRNGTWDVGCPWHCESSWRSHQCRERAWQGHDGPGVFSRGASRSPLLYRRTGQHPFPARASTSCISTTK